jgi:hypothetical protein
LLGERGRCVSEGGAAILMCRANIWLAATFARAIARLVASL